MARRYQTFAVPHGVQFNDVPITDHNRQPISISWERLENRQRMANGTLRVQTIANKHNFDLSWTDVPNDSQYTVDGLGGGQMIVNFGNLGQPFPMYIRYTAASPQQVYTVMPVEVNFTVKKRGVNMDLWDVSLSLEEV